MTNSTDHQINDLLPYFKSKLSREKVSEAAIEKVVDEDAFAAILDEKSRTRIKRILKQEIVITQEKGVLIQADCKPWLAARRAQSGGIDEYYWPRLQKYMIETGELPSTVVSTLDRVTDEILDCCGDPQNPDNWSSRGMVMGHVQSGKTTNYGALICKAADSGYKVIILLAGITNSLRSQTQQRMDEYFIGRKSVFNAAAEVPLPIIHYSIDKKIRKPDFGTSRDMDFNRSNAVSGAAFSSLIEPKIFVIKKNKSVLENLSQWINSQSLGQTINEPLLMIDDEADNASINTHKDPQQSTAINNLIKEILSQFNRSTYIGYTATPFANIFIDPESQDLLKREDLFPRNFIKALEPPTNYCGAKRYFSDEGNLRKASVLNLNEFDENYNNDYKDILPLPHKKNHRLSVIPRSLEYAIRCFILGRAVRILRGDDKKHATMMINVSRFNDVQDKVEGEVYKYLTRLSNAITVFSKSAEPYSDPYIEDLHKAYVTEFNDVKVDDILIDFDSVLPALAKSIASVKVSTINMRRKEGALNYDAHKENGLHVIAIGGLALSRGLTLEGLTTTYLLRNVGASDTLMQMARWFGYRTNYEDLCRIFLPTAAIAHYESIHTSIEELREEIDRMSLIGATPMEFGLKVRQSETGIRITAANKMQSATQMKLAAGYAGSYVQAHTIHNRQEVNSKNLELGSQFVIALGAPNNKTTKIENLPPFYWNQVDGGCVLNFLEQLEFPKQIQSLMKLEGKRSTLSDYFSDRLNHELKLWDVCLVTRNSAAKDVKTETNFLPGYELNPIQRSAAAIGVNNTVYQFTGSKNSVGDPDSPKTGLSKEEIDIAQDLKKIPFKNNFCSVRECPLLLIFLINPARTEKTKGLSMSGPLFSIALCLPETDVEVSEKTYQINKILKNQIQKENEDNLDDDEAEIGELL